MRWLSFLLASVAGPSLPRQPAKPLRFDLDEVGWQVAPLPALTSLYSGIETEERRVGKECRSRWSPYH